MARIAVIDYKKIGTGGCCQEVQCQKACPINRTGTECVRINERGFAEIDESLCNGCGICPKKCPFEAIKIINLPEALDKPPIHQYGKNGFRVYNLPIPVFGKVVGLLGINGIGKSTAIKILAGALKPNMGKVDKEKEITYDDVISYFKGTENQLFFDKIKKGEIKVSFKPQQVDLLPRTIKGKVIDLLKKVDEKKKYEEVAKELDLTNFLERDISQLSGGELQRVAIAATVLKEANFYIFDEPTSYLDVKQRLKVAKFIKNLANEKTAVLVIEHDLIILDYMTDFVHIMYGVEDAYGVIGLPRSTKNGINTFLDGYLPEENVRFRKHKVEFVKREQKDIGIKQQLTEWTDIKKDFGSFKLNVGEGKIDENETIGVLGPNGIGKTTFIKILAGVDKADSGECKTKVKVSYKPQYIDTTNEITVYELFINEWEDIFFEINIKKPLHLDKIKNHKVCELSGGQLQRVAIADCLRKKADLYLLDEPSAYLDIEQRLEISKIIRNVMELYRKTAMVVDHDLMFLDYISDKLIVFEGIPAKHGKSFGPVSMQKGMTHFLTDIGVTFRRDEETLRPRTNKEDSQLDKMQKSEDKYYYT